MYPHAFFLNKMVVSKTKNKNKNPKSEKVTVKRKRTDSKDVRVKKKTTVTGKTRKRTVHSVDYNTPYMIKIIIAGILFAFIGIGFAIWSYLKFKGIV